MKRKILSFVLILALFLVFLAVSCKNETTETPEETQKETENSKEPEVILGPENTLTSAGETITLNVIEDKLYITNLATLATGENKLMENSELMLPTFAKQFKEDEKSYAVEWKYDSVVRYDNKEVNGVMTSGLIYKFKDDTQNLILNVDIVVRPSLSGPFEIDMTIENLNDVEYRINLDNGYTSFATKVIDPAETNIVRIASESYCAEGIAYKDDTINYEGEGIYITNLAEDNTKTITSARKNFFGNAGHYLAQYIDRTNDGVFIGLGWTSGRVASRVQNNGSIVTKAYIVNGDGNFSTLIPAGDTFVIPTVYVLPYEGSMDDGSNIFKSWFFDCKVVPTLRDDPALPYVQTDGAFGGIERTKEVGIDSVKWEYGWWSGYYFGTGGPYPAESAWTLLADGLDSPGITQKELAEYGAQLDEYGLNFTTYLLLHDNCDLEHNPTEEYGEFNSITHPEWFSNQTHVAGALADLGNVDCVAYLKEKLENFFKLNNVDQWRTDFEPIAVYSDKENRHDANGSDVIYWCTVGFTEIIQHLYDTVEGFKYESCSSGGGNKDLYIAELATFFNCDDTANYLSLRTTFYDSSYIIHPAQLEIPLSPTYFDTDYAEYNQPAIAEPAVEEGDTYDFHKAMMDMGFRTTLQGIPMWGSAGPDYTNYYDIYAHLYKEKVKPLVREAELYHILPRPDGVNWDGIMYADPDTEREIKGLVFIYKPSMQAENVQHIVLDGLNEDTLYQLTFEDHPEQNCTVTGASLMTEGIDVTIKYIGSELIWITEAE